MQRTKEEIDKMIPRVRALLKGKYHTQSKKLVRLLEIPDTYANRVFAGHVLSVLPEWYKEPTQKNKWTRV